MKHTNVENQIYLNWFFAPKQNFIHNQKDVIMIDYLAHEKNDSDCRKNPEDPFILLSECNEKVEITEEEKSRHQEIYNWELYESSLYKRIIFLEPFILNKYHL